jgi:hypothetical protein
MAERPLRLGLSLAACFVIIAACGGGGPGAGFGGGGSGNGADATTEGSGHHGGGDDSGISLLGDTGSGGGNDAPAPCTGIACQVKNCGPGGDTTVSGYVYAPNGTLPLYDVQVFIPNAPLAPLPKGVQCDQCGAPVSGSPITTGLSDPTGYFQLKGVPAGTNIPIVVQLGKWRRQATIPNVSACTANALTDPNLTRLPKTQAEGSMPHVALTIGECDQMGCMLPKIGIDPSEFGYESDGYAKAINTYQPQDPSFPSTSWPQAAAASDLWGNPTLLATYDVGIFSCECSEALETKGGSPSSADFANITNYLDAGGRIFTTDFQYTWYKFSPDPNLGGGSETVPTVGIGEIYGGAPLGDSPLTLATSFPKGAALAAWMKNIYSGVALPSGVTFPVDSYAQMGEVNPDVMYGNIQTLNTPQTVTWGSSDYDNEGFEDPPPPSGVLEPRVFTVDTPVGKPTAMQCGRGVHLDMHVDNDGETVGPGYPTTGCTTTLKPDEAMFAFFFFDLSSCIQNETMPPVPPPVPPPPK